MRSITSVLRVAGRADPELLRLGVWRHAAQERVGLEKLPQGRIGLPGIRAAAHCGRTARDQSCLGRHPEHRDGASPRAPRRARHRVPRLPSGRDTAVVDGDGIRIAALARKRLERPEAADVCARRGRVQQDAVFRPIGIEHVLLNIAIRKHLSGSTRRSSAPSHGAATMDLVPAWSLQNRLAQDAGGPVARREPFLCFGPAVQLRRRRCPPRRAWRRIKPQELPGAPSFRDPDGMLLQVSPVN